jgi:hypothetical protein
VILCRLSTAGKQSHQVYLYLKIAWRPRSSTFEKARPPTLIDLEHRPVGIYLKCISMLLKPVYMKTISTESRCQRQFVVYLSLQNEENYQRQAFIHKPRGSMAVLLRYRSAEFLVLYGLTELDNSKTKM